MHVLFTKSDVADKVHSRQVRSNTDVPCVILGSVKACIWVFHCLPLILSKPESLFQETQEGKSESTKS